MNKQEKQKFKILCDTASRIISSYHYHPWLPHWLLKFFRLRKKQVRDIIHTIKKIKSSLKADDTYHAKESELLKALNFYRYMLSVHAVSYLLREKTQDALLACVTFDDSDLKAYQELIIKQHNNNAYFQQLQNDEELEAYKQHVRQRQTIYGKKVALLSDQEVTLAAKGGLINGKLLEYFGVRHIVSKTLKTIKNELQTLIDKKIEAGFLTKATIEGYLEKIELLQSSCDDKTTEVSELIHHARYLLENITNTAGVRQLGPARHLQHAVLVASCYWLDELLQQAQVKEDIFISD